MSNVITPQIYVACLASYNNGILYGEWLDVPQDVETLESEIARILRASPMPGAEEWAIHDYDAFSEAGSILGEYPNLQKVIDVARLIEEHGELAAKVIAHFGDIDEAKKAITENYCGCYKSLADYAEEFTEETGVTIPDNLRHYIDYEKMARDWRYSGDIFTIETGLEKVHVFLLEFRLKHEKRPSTAELITDLPKV